MSDVNQLHASLLQVTALDTPTKTDEPTRPEVFTPDLAASELLARLGADAGEVGGYAI